MERGNVDKMGNLEKMQLAIELLHELNTENMPVEVLRDLIDGLTGLFSAWYKLHEISKKEVK